MTFEQLKEMARHAAHRTAPENYSVASVDQAIADEFKARCDTINHFMKNRFDIYDIIIENADSIVPDKVMQQLSPFAEVRVSKQGDKILFKRGGLGRARAKKFLTQVGLSGVYESFRLDSETFTVSMKSIGGAVSVDFERLKDGAESLSEFMDVLVEAQEDAIYAEIQNALIAATSHMPTKNYVSGTYDASNLQNLVNTVKTYGGSATIFASPEFIAAMGPDAIAANTYADDDINSIHNTGKIRVFRGTPVVEIRQSFVDETNDQVMINPQFAYVLPSGNEKVVKLVMEGNTEIYDHKNVDQSIEIFTYRKIGVGISAYNNWGVYQNTSIDATNWYNDDVLGIDVNLHI